MPKVPGPFPFDFRTGVEGLVWKGPRTEGDPASIPANQLRMLINGRLRGGEVYARGDLSPFNTTPFGSANACITHLSDYQVTTPVRLWIVGDGCPGVDSSIGFYVAHLDPEQNPEFQRAVYYSALTQSIVMGKYGDDVYLGTDAALRKLQLIAQPYGTENITISGSSQDVPIETFTGFRITFLQEFDGKLFIGLDGGAGASKIMTWDGVSLRQDVAAINPPTCAALYHAPNGGDALFVGFGPATNLLKYRVTGSSPGTWANVAPGAGTLGANEMLAVGDKLFIASTNAGAGAIWRYDGVTLASHHVPAGATACRTLTRNASVLYFGYDTATAAIIGSYDLTTYTDVVNSLTASFALVSTLKSLRYYRGFLYAGATRNGAGRIYVSPAAGGFTSAWSEIIPNAGNNGAVDTLMVA